MAVLTFDQIAGMSAVVLNGYDYGKAAQIMQDLTDYPIANEWVFGGGKGVKEMQRGKNITFAVHYDASSSFRMTGLYDTDQVNATESYTTATIPWKYSNWNYGWDEHEEDVITDRAEVANYVEGRAAESWLGAVVGVEEKVWTLASDPTSKDQIWSIPTWVQKPTNGQVGFLGGNPTGFTSGIGLDASTYTNWKNYVADYAAITQADFVLKFKNCLDAIMFKAPPKVATEGYATTGPHWCATNLATIRSLETLAENQNDQLGFDLDAAHGKFSVRGNRPRYIPYLDADTTNPIYLLNTAHFKVFMHPKWAPRAHPLKKAPNQRNVLTKQWDMMWNLGCRDRRRQACLAIV